MVKILEEEKNEEVHDINGKDGYNDVRNENYDVKNENEDLKKENGDIYNENKDLNNKTDIKEITKKKKKKSSKYKIISWAFIILLLIAGAHIIISVSSNRNAQVIKFEGDEVMKINNQKVVMNEFLLYAADVYQGYNLQNESNWDSVIADSDNSTTTFEEQVKGTICEQIRMTKVLCMKAQDDGISLSNDENEILLENAKTYYKDLTSANVINKGLTVDLITDFYEENALAQKVYNNILNSYDENQNSPTLEDYDTEGTDLSEKELYFIDVYDKLAEKYDKNYDYYTSINWDLLEQLSFSDISKDNSTEADTSENTSN